MLPGGYFPSIAERLGLVPRGTAAQASWQAQQDRYEQECMQAALDARHEAPHAWQQPYGMSFLEPPSWAPAPGAMAPRAPLPDDGILVSLSNKSGHYKPESTQLRQCHAYLCETLGLQTRHDFELVDY